MRPYVKDILNFICIRDIRLLVADDLIDKEFAVPVIIVARERSVIPVVELDEFLLPVHVLNCISVAFIEKRLLCPRIFLFQPLQGIVNIGINVCSKKIEILEDQYWHTHFPLGNSAV